MEPVFGFGGYINGSGGGAASVAAERVMEEPGARHFLQFDSYGAGLQVFLDHALLYTDFPAEENLVDFLRMSILPVFPTTGSAFHCRRTAAGSGFALSPTDPPAMAFASRYLPSLVGRFSDAVVQTSGVVWPMAAVTAQLLLAICLLLVLLLGRAHDGEFLWKLLPLIGYFLLAAAAGVCHTYLEISAGLNADAGLLNWVYLIYMDLLYAIWPRRCTAGSGGCCSPVRCSISCFLRCGASRRCRSPVQRRLA